MCCIRGLYTILSCRRRYPLQLAYLWQMIIGLETNGLILDSLLSFADKAKDLFANYLWLRRFECVRIKLILYCN